MNLAGEVRELLVRSMMREGEADGLMARATLAARRGRALEAWEFEQQARCALAEGRAFALQARELLEQQEEAARVASEACAICAAALVRG